MTADRTMTWYIQNSRPIAALEYALRLITIMETDHDLGELQQELVVAQTWFGKLSLDSFDKAITTAIMVRRSDFAIENYKKTRG